MPTTLKVADNLCNQTTVDQKLDPYVLPPQQTLIPTSTVAQIPSAAPRSTIDRSFVDQVNFDIENRDPNEITKIRALSDDGKLKTVNYPAMDVSNPAFDITPSHLISGIITEAGVISSDNLKSIL